jgi:hypothetical protein
MSDLMKRLLSGELSFIDANPDSEAEYIAPNPKTLENGKVKKLKVKSKPKLSARDIKDGTYTIKEIIETKPNKTALKEWLKIRIMELTASDSEED